MPHVMSFQFQGEAPLRDQPGPRLDRDICVYTPGPAGAPGAPALLGHTTAGTVPRAMALHSVGEVRPSERRQAAAHKRYRQGHGDVAVHVNHAATCS